MRQAGPTTACPFSSSERLGPSIRSEILSREFPVQDIVEHGLHVLGAAILKIEVLRVLPNVDHEQRSRPLHHGRSGVASPDDLQLLPVEHHRAQPDPNCVIAAVSR